MTVTLTIPPAQIAPAVVRVDYDRLLACIIQVEGHRWEDEGGALAFTRDAWKEVTELPYRMAKHCYYAREVAHFLLAKHERNLAAAGIAITPESLATAWRWGLTGAIRRKGKSEYGSRTANLYFDR